MWRRVSYVLVGVQLTACAAATTASSRQAFRSAGHDVITAAEIVAARVTDAYQAVVQLRPEFLRRQMTRQATVLRPDSIAVYLDDMLLGTEQALKGFPLDQIRQIRYMSSNEADMRWGRSHPVGAILVTTVRK